MMKHQIKNTLLLVLLMSAQTIHTGWWHHFTHHVSHAFHSATHAIAHTAKEAGHDIKKGADAVGKAAKDVGNDIKNAAVAVGGFIGTWNPVAIVKDVKSEKKAISAAKDNAPVLIKKITDDVSQLERIFTSQAVSGNLTALQSAKNIVVQEFPGHYSPRNFNPQEITTFINNINKAYKDLQKPIQALFNLMTISFQAFGVMADLSVTAGDLSGYIGGALTPLPLSTPRKTGHSFDSLKTTLTTNLPATFTLMHGSVNNLKGGMNNIYLNIGGALHTLQEKALMLQHMLNLFKMISGFGGDGMGGAAPPPPPPPPPGPPAPPPPPANFGPEGSPNGAPPLPPPPPPVSPS